MNRILQVQFAVLRVIAFQSDIEIPGGRAKSLDWERVHMASCARTAQFIAQLRGVDHELASCAAAVHDFGRIITGIHKNHAEVGYVPVQRFLKNEGIFTDSEISQIAMAVKNHSSKTTVGSPLDEVVKDADVIDCYELGEPFDRVEKEKRYNAWLQELDKYKRL
ncbi:MAG: HD domain-containing protein [Oscillospiraceae bacterium]|nr:HD domain-containing protein [Oscillospiraceae bacterium]